MPHEVMRLFNELHAGVSLFFVLSGFLIAYTYAHKPAASADSYLRYILVRMARILPLYWLILTFFYIDNDFGKKQFSLLTYSLAHGFSNQHNLDAISQSWSLTVEMSFYLLAPLLFLLLRKGWGYLVVVLIGLFVISIAVGLLWNDTNGNKKEFFYPVQLICNGVFTGRSSEFVAGMMLAYGMQTGYLKWLDKIKYKTITGFAAMFISLYIIGLFQPDIYHHGYETATGMFLSKFLLPVTVVIALYGLITENTGLGIFFGSRPMILLGNASFAFYLVHISYVNLKLKQWVFLPDRNFVLLWAISIILYLLFEKPVYDFCRKKLKRQV